MVWGGGVGLETSSRVNTRLQPPLWERSLAGAGDLATERPDCCPALIAGAQQTKHSKVWTRF